jgi:outer membrane lipoprotein-sorting protein
MAVHGSIQPDIMRTSLSGTFARTCLVVLTFATTPFILAQQSSDAASTESVGKLDLDHVLTKLAERNAQRAAALQEFEGTRIYRMQYRGFPSDRDAEMVVKVKFHAPNSKEFRVVSQNGSKFVLDHIFRKLLDGEEEASADDIRHDMALTRENYDFELAGFEPDAAGGHYVLNLVPKTKNKFLYRGKIWVDGKDFAVVRIEGEPAKNPSFWIKKTEIAHSYKKVEDFWLPAENHTESSIRLGGKAILFIEYQDYKIIKAKPANIARSPRETNSLRQQSISGGEPAVWAAHIIALGTD